MSDVSRQRSGLETSGIIQSQPATRRRTLAEGRPQLHSS